MMGNEIEIELSSSELQAAVDGPAAAVSAVVRNRSAVVDQYSFRLEGLDPAWWEVIPGTVSLFPGDEATVTLKILVPAGAVAGIRACRLAAVSADDRTRTAAVDLALEVAPAGGIALSLDPTASCGRKGRHTVTVRNGRNEDVRLSLAGRDAEEALEYSFEPPALVVPPFSTAVSSLEVRPRSRPLQGRVRSHRFSVQATPEGSEQPVAEAEGETEYRPPIGPLGLPQGRWAWLLALIPLLALALLVRSLLEDQSAGGSRAAAEASATAQAAVAVPPGALGGGSAPPPEIRRLAAGKEQEEGIPAAVAVHWDVERGDTVKAGLREAGYGPLGEPSRRGEYLVEASGRGGAAADSVHVVLLGPPVIKRYRANPPKVPEGGTVRLEYELVGADEADIEGRPIDPEARQFEIGNLKLDQSGGYILHARNGVGMVSSIAFFEVVPGLTATPSSTPTRTAEPTTATAAPRQEPTSAPPPTGTPWPAAPTDTPVPPTATHTQAATSTPTPSQTPPPPPCTINSFSVSPNAATAPFLKQQVVLRWSCGNAGSIAIRWDDDAGSHEYRSRNAADQTAQEINKGAAGTVTFRLYGYRDANWTEPSCVGPAEVGLNVQAPPTSTPTPTSTPFIRIIIPTVIVLPTATPTPTPVPLSIRSFSVNSRCTGGSSPTVSISWSATGGADARVYLYRNKHNAPASQTTLVNGSPSLTGSYTDVPPSGQTINYTLVVRNSAGQSVSQTQPGSPYLAVCIY